MPITKHLCDVLMARLQDRALKWAYHPQSNNVGRTVAESFLSTLATNSGAIGRVLRSGQSGVSFNGRVAGKRRSKRIDLVIGPLSDPPTQGTLREDEVHLGKVARPEVLLEVKACMTAHGKAYPRLADELTSTLELAESLRAKPVLCGLIVMNYASEFTSPLNLPGPNEHRQPKDADGLLARVMDVVPVGEDGYDVIGVIAIDFDNECSARPFTGTRASIAADEAKAIRAVDRVYKESIASA